MRDDKRTEQIESRAATVEEAISEALLRLGARRDEVEIEVVEEGKAGVLGLFGRRQARVLATRKRKRSRGKRGGRRRRGSSSSAEGQSGGDRSKEKAQGGGERREAAEGKRPPRERPSRERPDRERPARERSAREDDQSARRRPPRTRPDSARKPSGRADAERPQAEAPPAQETRKEARPTAESRPAGEPLAAAKLVAPTRGLSSDDAAEVQRNMAEELMRRAGFFSRCTVVEGEYNQVKITVDTDSAAVLIGRRGSTIDSVEHLVERMANQAIGDHARMNLDINNYRRRRDGTLETNAQDAVRQMIETGKDVHTPPLCARERRIVHLTVEKIPGATTYTAGFGADRHVVITSDEKSDEDKPAEEEVSKEEATEDEADGNVAEAPSGPEADAAPDASAEKDADGD